MKNMNRPLFKIGMEKKLDDEADQHNNQFFEAF